MSATPSSPLLQNLRWMSDHAGFPASRLPDKAELLLLIAAAADGENGTTADTRRLAPGMNANYTAQMRNYSIQRRKVHYKCDNSAKV